MGWSGMGDEWLVDTKVMDWCYVPYFCVMIEFERLEYSVDFENMVMCLPNLISYCAFMLRHHTWLIYIHVRCSVHFPSSL